MFRNMVTSLFKYERIKTTDQKAKELRGWADHIITLAKRGDLHARRQAMAIVREKAVVHKVFEEAPERFASVSGGYTRVIKLGRRPGDAAMMSLIELVAPETQKPKKKTTKKPAAKVEPQKAAAESTPAEDTAEDQAADQPATEAEEAKKADGTGKADEPEDADPSKEAAADDETDPARDAEDDK
jgi:large subunit ribosomal protein L17